MGQTSIFVLVERISGKKEETENSVPALAVPGSHAARPVVHGRKSLMSVVRKRRQMSPPGRALSQNA